MGCLESIPCIPNVPKAPDLNEAIDMEAVGESITDACEAIPDNISKNKREFPGELRNCPDDEWDVPDTTMKLKKEATQQEIDEAAIVSACGTAVKDAMKDSIWGQIEGKVDDLLAEVEPALPDQVKNKAKDKFKENTIDPLVDAAVDKCLDEAKKAMGNGDNVEEEQVLKNNEEKVVELVVSKKKEKKGKKQDKKNIKNKHKNDKAGNGKKMEKEIELASENKPKSKKQNKKINKSKNDKVNKGKSENEGKIGQEYKVVFEWGAKCRKKKDKSSAEVGIISMNEIVIVEEIVELRCRISSPMKGWVSLRTTDGNNILILKKIKSKPKKNNNKLSKKELMKMSKVELVKLCKKNKVASNGTKNDMVDRIMDKNSHEKEWMD